MAVEGGDGGFVETSSKDEIQFGNNAMVAAGAPAGVAGEWLLDPFDLLIEDTVGDANADTTPPVFTPTGTPSSIATATIEGVLDGGTDLTITTVGSGGAEAGNITIRDPIDTTTGALQTLTFEAEGDIISDNPDADTGGTITDTGSGLNVIMQAQQNITLGFGIITNGGAVTLAADHDFGGGEDPASVPTAPAPSPSTAVLPQAAALLIFPWAPVNC
ncbi:MAG: hypothetical protein U5P41_09675 [Gammaproteobacteria bacterium]|nr:hypothetical protein [Gammaproteobacteria bacterium]